MGQITVGKHTVFYDDIDFLLIISHNWRIYKGSNTKYALTTIKGKTVHMHQLIKPTYDPTLIHDHKDCNGLNNCRDNIQLITQAQNCQRRKPNRFSNIAKYKGISFISSRLKYQATIQVKGKSINLGRYNTIQSAVIAYNEAARQYFGEFAFINKLKPEDLTPSVSVCTEQVPETQKEEKNLES